MKKWTWSKLVFALLVVAVMFGGGVANAYLSPMNPAAAPEIIPSIIDDPNFVIGPGDIPDYLSTANWAYSPPLTKFVDSLPPLGCGPDGNNTVNNLGQCIPVAVPDIVTYPGTDYYVIELVEFSEQMHTGLPLGTTIRGYRQANNGTNTSACSDPVLGEAAPCTDTDNTDDSAVLAGAHYLGPIIVTQKDRPVRILFRNLLPQGSELMVPVDETIMGAGAYSIDYDPVTKELQDQVDGNFSQNRAELHLHGGRTPWISDGTPHQWITPANDDPNYPQGVSVEMVPDMPIPAPNSGEQTYFWTNQQSARMMFYHDHAWGITRLNVYVGQAAGYLVRDNVELDLINGTNVTGVNPDLTPGILPVDEIPLVIQDKTFVNASNPATDPNSIFNTDPTWRWGTGTPTSTTGNDGKTVNVYPTQTGDFWWPHVYMPAQNPYDPTGIAPMGRWAYGPYFWPPTNNEFQPVPNPYYSDACDPAGDPATTPGLLNGWCQPPMMPGTPNVSWGAEAFMDTPIVNGTAYPTITVDPKAYRFRILNAAHDRFFNLSMFQAVNKNNSNLETDDYTVNPAAICDGSQTVTDCTEVKMLPATSYAAAPASWPTDGRPGGIPDWTTAGPDWIMIGSEGGFLPRPVKIPAHPIDWNVDVTTFNAGNVNKGSLILGPAERADVIVDFSQFAGQTLILYNDAPAPWPALDFHYDYYTGAPDAAEAGGYSGTIPAGVGPNIRTVMQIQVGTTGVTPYEGTAMETALFDAFTHQTGKPSVFEEGQDTLIVGQGNLNPSGDPALYEAFPHDGLYAADYNAYNEALGATFPTSYQNWGISQIGSQSLNYYDVGSGTIKNTPMKFKAIQDEQGETFDMYGRMRAALGIEFANPGAGQVNFVVQTYSDPTTEILNPNEVQVWKITHNGVDTHPVHFHLYDVQVLNRVGWDGFLRLPDPTELGWKDTVRISPLEDTIVALRPITPRVPFGVPESYRPKNPATLLGEQTELTQIDPFTAQARNNVNDFVNLDWEYVWHCHILSHEENDMMRSQSFQFVEGLPDTPSTLVVTANGANQNDLVWTDPTPVNFVNLNNFGNPKNEIGFRIERSSNGGPFEVIGHALANATTYSDTTAAAGSTYTYRVVAYNAKGDSLPAGTIPSNLTLAIAPASPKVPGTSVKFTAGASGGLGSYQYQFYVKGPNDAVATLVQSWSASNIYNWSTPATLGTYTVGVQVKNVGAAGFQAQKWTTYQVVAAAPPVTGATLSGNPTSPRFSGTQVTFTAGGIGGSGTYEYQFFVKGPNDATATLVKAYSTSNSLQWTAPATLGTYNIGVQVRNLGSTAGFQAQKWMTYQIVANVPAATGATLSANPASPQGVGTSVTFTAGGDGGSGTYQYRFFLKGPNDPVATQVQPYSASNTYNWTIPATLGNYSIGVQVRSQGSIANFEAQKWMTFTVQ